MKKFLLLTAAALCTGLASAQTIDWSVDQVLKPTDVKSDFTPSSTVNYDVVLKNLGTDSAKAGDTVFYQLVLTTTSNQLIVAAPNSTSFYFMVLKKSIKMNDTMHLTGSFNFGAYPYVSLDVKFTALSYLVNRGRGVSLEGSSTTANNSKSANIVWYNPQGWAVSTKDASTEINKVYPSVVKNELTLTTSLFEKEGKIAVNIFDLSGRLVSAQEFVSGQPSYNINTTALSNGSYIVKVANGARVSSQKIIVQK